MTRSLIIMISDGEYKIAEYCNADGYASGVGVYILDFLRGMDKEHFKKQLRPMVLADYHMYNYLWQQHDNAIITTSEYNRILRGHRGMGWEILRFAYTTKDTNIYMDSELIQMHTWNIDYVWVVDLDKDTYEGYYVRGQQPPEGQRFHTPAVGQKTIELWKEAVEKRGRPFTLFYPHLLAEFSLADLPTDEDFVKACNNS